MAAGEKARDIALLRTANKNRPEWIRTPRVIVLVGIPGKVARDSSIPNLSHIDSRLETVRRADQKRYP